MVSDYIFPTESTTCFENLTLTPLTTFSTVSDFAENLDLLQPSNPRRGATLGRAGRPSIKLLLVSTVFTNAGADSRCGFSSTAAGG
jgi:hypothetical protein